MTPITENQLAGQGWKVTKRERWFLFMEIQWNKFNTLKISFDSMRGQWRLHYMYNDTCVKFMEDIDTMAELWSHAFHAQCLNLLPKEKQA